MRKAVFLIVVGVIVAGTVKADPLCTANTLAFYEANVTTASTACSIGGLNFSVFNGANSGTTGSGPTTGLGASQIELTPVTGGFLITPIGTFEATATGILDAEIPFEVTCANGTNCLTSVTMSMTGSVTTGTVGSPGLDTLTETYCIGGVVPPPTGPCPVGSMGAVTQDKLTIGLSGPDTVSQTDTFTAVSELSMNKDIQAFGNGGTATVTSVSDIFSTPPPTTTPEPSSLLLLAAGVAGLFLLSKRQGQVG